MFGAQNIKEIAPCANCETWFEFLPAIPELDKEGKPTGKIAKNSPLYFVYYEPNGHRKVLCSEKCKDNYVKKYS